MEALCASEKSYVNITVVSERWIRKNYVQPVSSYRYSDHLVLCEQMPNTSGFMPSSHWLVSHILKNSCLKYPWVFILCETIKYIYDIRIMLKNCKKSKEIHEVLKDNQNSIDKDKRKSEKI